MMMSVAKRTYFGKYSNYYNDLKTVTDEMVDMTPSFVWQGKRINTYYDLYTPLRDTNFIFDFKDLVKTDCAPLIESLGYTVTQQVREFTKHFLNLHTPELQEALLS